MSQNPESRDVPPHSPAGSDFADRANSSSGWLLGLFAILCAAGLCWSTLASGEALTLDEHVSYWIMNGSLGESIWNRSLNYAATPPLGSWCQQAVLSLSGKQEWAVRLPSVAGFCLGVLVLILAGRGTRFPLCGVWGALLLAWHPLALQESRIGRFYGLLILCSACCLTALLAWRRRPQSVAAACGFAVSSLAVVWTHYVAALFPAWCLLCFLLIPCRRQSAPEPGIETRQGRPPVRQLAVVLAILVLGALPLLPSIRRLADWAPFLDFRQVRPHWHDLIEPFGIFLGVLCCAVAVHRWLARSAQPLETGARREAVFFACLGILPLGIWLVVTHWLPSLAAPRYRTPFAVTESLAAGYFLCLLTENLRSRTACRVAIATFALTAIWLTAGVWPWEPVRIQTADGNDWRTAAATIKTEGKPHDLLLVQSGLMEAALVPTHFADPVFMDYVACRLGTFYLPDAHIRLAIPFFWSQNPQVATYFHEHLKKAAAKNESVWVVAATDTDVNRESLRQTRTLLQLAGWSLTQELPGQFMWLGEFEYGGKERL